MVMQLVALLLFLGLQLDELVKLLLNSLVVRGYSAIYQILDFFIVLEGIAPLVADRALAQPVQFHLAELLVLVLCDDLLALLVLEYLLEDFHQNLVELGNSGGLGRIQ